MEQDTSQEQKPKSNLGTYALLAAGALLTGGAIDYVLDGKLNAFGLLDGNSSKIVDSDGDFLGDDYEKMLGSNPSLRDTDGDGIDDLREALGPDRYLKFIEASGENLSNVLNGLNIDQNATAQEIVNQVFNTTSSAVNSVLTPEKAQALFGDSYDIPFDSSPGDNIPDFKSTDSDSDSVTDFDELTTFLNNLEVSNTNTYNVYLDAITNKTMTKDILLDFFKMQTVQDANGDNKWVWASGLGGR